MALSPLQNLTVVYKETMMQGDVVDRKRLEDLHPEQYTSILILSDADNLGTVDSDSRCIAGALPVLCYLRKSSVQLPGLPGCTVDATLMQKLRGRCAN